MSAKYDLPNPDLEALWGLPDGAREDAARRLFRTCAESFLGAEQAGEFGVAQQAMMVGMKILAGMFPDRRDPSHDLLAAMLSMMVDIRQGSRTNPILNHRAPMRGGSKGMGRVELGGFAIAMARLAEERQLFASEAQMWKSIAALVSAAGVNLYAGADDRLAEVSGNTVRRWVRSEDEFEAQHHFARAAVPIHRENLERRGVSGLADFLAYFRSAADEAVARWMQSRE